MRTMPNQAGLAMTAADHWDIGSTPPQVLRDNPGKTYLETMTEEELRARLRRDLTELVKSYLGALTGDPLELKIFRLVRMMVLPNILYLRKLKRLPPEFRRISFYTSFRLPRKRLPRDPAS